MPASVSNLPEKCYKKYSCLRTPVLRKRLKSSEKADFQPQSAAAAGFSFWLMRQLRVHSSASAATFLHFRIFLSSNRADSMVSNTAIMTLNRPAGAQRPSSRR